MPQNNVISKPSAGTGAALDGRPGGSVAAPPRPRVESRRANREFLTEGAFVETIAEFSHDVRTPLCVIREYASLLREGILGVLNKEQFAAADVVCGRADEIQRMVESLLLAARRSGGFIEARGERCNVDELPRRQAPGGSRELACSPPVPDDAIRERSR